MGGGEGGAGGGGGGGGVVAGGVAAGGGAAGVVAGAGFLQAAALRLTTRHNPSNPAIRVDTVILTLFLAPLRRGGARVLTVASDGASQRMRDLVDRKHSEEQLVRAAQFAASAGMERLKVY